MNSVIVRHAAPERVKLRPLNLPLFRCWHADGRTRRVTAHNASAAISLARGEAMAETDHLAGDPAARERLVAVVMVERDYFGRWKRMWAADAAR
jgi:hypothetical protein